MVIINLNTNCLIIQNRTFLVDTFNYNPRYIINLVYIHFHFLIKENPLINYFYLQYQYSRFLFCLYFIILHYFILILILYSYAYLFIR